MALRKLMAPAVFLLATPTSLAMEEQLESEGVDLTPSGVLNNLIEMDTLLFDELIAGKAETKVRNGQTWLVFFDSQAC